MKAVLQKIASTENATTNRVWKFGSLIDDGLVEAKKLYTGPLKLHDGSYRLSLTEKGRKIINL